ncbi:hypothetical protein DVH05_023278 [Phytophthora capsici]|nr:hypothetical protein DVH05_023278 [Phytophthora capsici]
MRFESQQQPSLEEEIYAIEEEPECAMHGPVIREHQIKDEMIQKIKTACLAGDNNPGYKLMPLLGCSLVAYHGRVIFLESLQEDLVDWYHHNLAHPGSERQFKTIRWLGFDTVAPQQLLELFFSELRPGIMDHLSRSRVATKPFSVEAFVCCTGLFVWLNAASSHRVA